MDSAQATSLASKFGVWRRVPIGDAEALIRAESVDEPHLVILGNEQALTVCVNVKAARLTVGRSSASHLPLSWDRAVSSVHAAVARELDLFTIEDLGPSRNGTFVNGIQATARTRLEDRDVIRCGSTEITVRCPVADEAGGTELLPVKPDWSSLTPMERRVVLALIELWPAERRHFDPPPNLEIGAELGIGYETVRTHMVRIYKKLSAFGVENNRTAVAEAATRDERALRALAPDGS